MTTKRIAFVCISLRSGGAEKVLSLFANNLTKDFHVTIITLRETEPFYPLDGSIDVYPFSSSLKPKQWLFYFPALLRHLIKSFWRAKPDCILSFGETISSFVLLAQISRPCPTLVFHRANPDVSLRGLRSIVNPWLFRMATYLIFQTESAEGILRHRYPFAKTKVLPNPVPAPERIKELKKRRKQIIFSGFIGGEKNQGALVRAFSACKNRAGWTIEFLGDGPGRQTLERLIKDRGLQSSVTIRGYTKNVIGELNDAQIFAFTSLTEGFPNSLAEGLAAGCAVISYDCPTGPSDLIEDGVNGLLVPCGDEDVFSQRLDMLLADGESRSEFSMNAREMIKKYDPERVYSELRYIIYLCVNKAG